MAVIELSAHMKGESNTTAGAGVCFSVSAVCRGRGAGFPFGMPPEEAEADTEETPKEPETPKGS